MKRFLTTAAAVASLLYLLVSYAPPVGSQIGYTSTSVASDLDVGTADFTLQGDDLYVGWGADDDWQLEYISANDELRIQEAGGTSILLLDVPVAAATQDYLSLTATALAANADDVVNAVHLAITNGNHTGTGNIVNILKIAAITGDANANLNAISIGALTATTGAAAEVEAAIEVGADWDFLINVLDAAPIIQFANNGTFGFQDAGSGALVFAIQDAGVVADGIVHTRAAATVSGSHYSAGRASSFAAQNGSDLAAFFRVDTFADAAHTSTGNDILAFHAETITSPDADSTHSLLGGEGGWDYLIWNNAALGTDAWTTALDKTANAKSGTLRVEINGTLYHIQLYADS